ncbi:hypothetical protein MAR_036814 [Mya arenaria]|uniref:Uncharacterized protein n=2 Tax=Mya arenaria TaxID=6604 RepID=A0ABY7FM59_MYAAR|nr:hypothetical protein MAR_036814 [Mya arenaria]
MQSILARLKASAYQNSDGNEAAETIDDRIKRGPSPINGVVNNAEIRNEKCRKQNVPKLNLDISKALTETIIDISPESSSTPDTDDALEIEIVMATNKSPSARVRQQSSSTSPRQLRKGSRNKGSRVSLNSIATGKDDVDNTGLDSEDDNDTQRSQMYTPQQAWSAFENCVKNIDNGNPEHFTKKPKPNFISSGTFQQVMVDMYGNSEYGNTKGYTVLKQKLNNMARATGLASRMMFSAINRGQEEREEEEARIAYGDTGEDEPDMSSHGEPESVTKVFAKRGWKMLKRQVNENAMEHHTQSTKLNWVMLQHTVKQMTNTEKTRQDLYERYGIVPTKLDDGTFVCENRMLSERARSQMYGRTVDGREYMRPSSYQPNAARLRSRSQLSSYSTTSQKKPRGNSKSGVS